MSARNPYQSPNTPDEPLSSLAIHRWRDMTFSVWSEYSARTLWSIGTVSVQIDAGEIFSSSSYKFKEDFRFEFVHNDRIVSARIRQTASAAKTFSYEIYVDDEIVGASRIVIRNWLQSFALGIGVGVLFFALTFWMFFALSS